MWFEGGRFAKELGAVHGPAFSLTQVNAASARWRFHPGKPGAGASPAGETRKGEVMALRDLLVYLDSTKASAARGEVALELAQRHGAHLTGLAPTATTVIPGYIAGSFPEELLRLQEDEARKQAEAAVDVFKQSADRIGASVETRVESCSSANLAQAIGLHTRYCDLIVLGQISPDESAPGGATLVEDVILAAGRPALVVPYVGVQKTPGRNVMLAWDASREAARAAQDALPILEAADEVTVLVVNAGRSSHEHGQEPGADIALHLSRHGVNAKVQRSEVKDISVGEEILSRMADMGTDLLVMGAYGHSRFREIILGGATRTLLEEMTVPVFMAH